MVKDFTRAIEATRITAVKINLEAMTKVELVTFDVNEKVELAGALKHVVNKYGKLDALKESYLVTKVQKIVTTRVMPLETFEKNSTIKSVTIDGVEVDLNPPTKEPVKKEKPVKEDKTNADGK
jgi:hypothetical protein